MLVSLEFLMQMLIPKNLAEERVLCQLDVHARLGACLDVWDVVVGCKSASFLRVHSDLVNAVDLVANHDDLSV